MRLLRITGLAALLLLTACKNEEKSTDSQTTPVDTVAEQSESLPGTATAAWTGKYTGVLPCGDCKGIHTVIEVKADSTYVLSAQALGKENTPRFFSGNYHFDRENEMITLDAKGDHLKFLVLDGVLIKRDKFGDPEQGGEEARYYLHKVR